MADRGEDRMNLDLNLGPVAPLSPRMQPISGRSSRPRSPERFQLDDRLTELLDLRIREILHNRWGRQSGGSSETQPGLGPPSGEHVHLAEANHDQRTRESSRTRSTQLTPRSPERERGSGPSFGEPIQFEESILSEEPDFMDDSFDQATSVVPGNSSRPLGTAFLGVEPNSVPSSDEDIHIGGIGLLDEPDLRARYGPSTREFARGRLRRWRWRQGQVSSGVQNFAAGSMVDSTDGGTRAGGEDGGRMLQSGEGSAAGEERNNHISKTCENNVAQLEDKAVDKVEDVSKGSGNEGGFFDCNICLDLAREPVVTCCGHLFCWPCIYRWLSLHSDAKECPVCKGEVTVKNVMPIYGRGNSTHEAEEDLGIKIPARPPAQRVESLRQAIQRASSSFPMDEMIRLLGSRYDLTRDLLQHQDIDNGSRDNLERGNFILNRILTSRRLRREQNLVVPAEGLVDLMQDSVRRPEVTEHRRLPSLIYRRSHSHRTPSTALTSSSNMGERVLEAPSRGHLPARSQEQPLSVDDRDSFSSIAAVIHGESQTVDTAVEIDSMVSLSTSSSRRQNDASRVSDIDMVSFSTSPSRRRSDVPRVAFSSFSTSSSRRQNDASRVSDIDSGDSRAPRRRRLN
ncbi:hypothetical protein Ancab_030927 [Ancistrocladus abbreviatus]